MVNAEMIINLTSHCSWFWNEAEDLHTNSFRGNLYSKWNKNLIKFNRSDIRRVVGTNSKHWILNFHIQKIGQFYTWPLGCDTSYKYLKKNPINVQSSNILLSISFVIFHTIFTVSMRYYLEYWKQRHSGDNILNSNKKHWTDNGVSSIVSNKYHNYKSSIVPKYDFLGYDFNFFKFILQVRVICKILLKHLLIYQTYMSILHV